MIKNVKSRIEPGLLRIFQYFTAVAVVYFAILWVYGMFESGFGESLKLQLWGNFVVYLGLFAYLNLPFLEKRLKNFYLPLGLAVSSIFPIAGNFMYLLDPQQVDLVSIINRSWIWLPILFVPLMLISWQYNFKAVLAFTIFTNGLELIVLLAGIDRLSYENLTLVSAPLIRAFAFGTVGYIVNTLSATQRAQNQKLIQTNLRLNQYVHTLEELATSRERNRLASELHDTLAHTLSGLSINLEAIKTVVPPKNEEAQEMLDHSLKTTRSGLDETRRVLKALRAGPLEALGLKQALANLTEEASLRKSIPIVCDCPDRLPVLPLEVEQNIYRITQEGLENILRHANASTAQVKLAASNGNLELIIQDNGSGFDPDHVKGEDKFGLQGLKERAAAIGGNLSVKSKPGEGTLIRFTWESFND
jgi:signal transduction histidine kinase